MQYVSRIGQSNPNKDQSRAKYPLSRVNQSKQNPQYLNYVEYGFEPNELLRKRCSSLLKPFQWFIDLFIA
jgi:hypothetical protein